MSLQRFGYWQTRPSLETDKYSPVHLVGIEPADFRYVQEEQLYLEQYIIDLDKPVAPLSNQQYSQI